MSAGTVASLDRHRERRDMDLRLAQNALILTAAPPDRAKHIRAWTAFVKSALQEEPLR